MCRTDHAGLGVGEQHRRAVGGEDAQREARAIGDQRIGMRPRRVVPRIGDGNRIGAVYLEHRNQTPARQHRFRREAAVFGDHGGIVVRAEPDIEPGMHARRHAATPAEKAMWNGQRGRADNFYCHSTSLMMRSSSIVSPTRKA